MEKPGTLCYTPYRSLPIMTVRRWRTIKNLYGYSGHVPAAIPQNSALLLQNMVLESQLCVTQTAEHPEPPSNKDILNEADAHGPGQNKADEPSAVPSDAHSVFRAFAISSTQETAQGRVGIHQSIFVKTAQAEPEIKRWWDKKI